MNIELPFDPKLTGKAFAAANDAEQGAFFNEMGRFLDLICKGRKDNQICYISDKLDLYGEEMVLSLAAFIEIKREKVNRGNQ